MDWIKSKSIVILALLLTNFILLFNVLESRYTFNTKAVNEDAQWEQVKAIVKDKNVHLASDEITYREELVGVRLEYQVYESEQIATNLLGSHDLALGKYTNLKGDQMTLENGNKLMYAKSIQNPETNLIDGNMAKTKADQFLNDMQFSSADMKFWDLRQGEGITTVIYRQYYEGLFLDDAYMAVTFKGNQVSTFERKWFNPPEKLSYVRKIIKPSQALFLAADLVRERAKNDEEVVIEALELGYRLDSSSLVSSVKAGEASPYWRVLMENGQVIYIEAQE